MNETVKGGLAFNVAHKVCALNIFKHKYKTTVKKRKKEEKKGDRGMQDTILSIIWKIN